MDHDALIFDLDGTLWDAAAASTLGWNLALEELQLPYRVTVDGIRSVSGNPFPRCVEILLPELHPASMALLSSLEAQERTGIERLAGVLYEGVAVGIALLAASHPLFIVSNCPGWYLEEFLRFSGFTRYLRGYDCHGLSGVGKAEMLAEMVRRFRLARPVYVGDTRGDRDAARQAGVEFAFAGYGFGSTVGEGLSFAAFAELVGHFLPGPAMVRRSPSG